MGLLIVFTVTYAGPRIGVAATVGILIAGQLAMGAAIDRWGLLRLRADPAPLAAAAWGSRCSRPARRCRCGSSGARAARVSGRARARRRVLGAGRRRGREVALPGAGPARRRLPPPALRLARALGDRAAAAARTHPPRARAARRARGRARLDEPLLLRGARPGAARDRRDRRVPRAALGRRARLPPGVRPRLGRARRGRESRCSRTGAPAPCSRSGSGSPPRRILLGLLHPARGAGRARVPRRVRARAGDGARCAARRSLGDPLGAAATCASRSSSARASASGCSPRRCRGRWRSRRCAGCPRTSSASS